MLDVKPSVSINNSVVSQKYLAWFGRKEGVQVNMSTTYGEEKVMKYLFTRKYTCSKFYSDWKISRRRFYSKVQEIPRGFDYRVLCKFVKL